MKRQRTGLFGGCESKAGNLKKHCPKKLCIPASFKAPVSSLNINSLPDLPFGTLFEWIPLVDLLSVQFVCQQWKEATVREASTHRDSIMLYIDGQAEDQKTARYLERSIWSIPHAEVLKNDDGTPLYPDYVPPSKRPTWNSILLGTRLDNPILLDGTTPTAEEHLKWQTDYDQSFEASLDLKVSQLRCLFPRGPRTLTIVCRSQHSDFLRLLPLLVRWKDRLITLNLYCSHPRALEKHQTHSHYRSSFINHTTNRPLLAVLNSMSSLLHLTLDLLGEEGGTLNDSLSNAKYRNELNKSGEIDLLCDFAFLRRLESFTFADSEMGELVQHLFVTNRLASRPLQALHLSHSFSTTIGQNIPNIRRLFSSRLHHFHLNPISTEIALQPAEGEQCTSPWASLTTFLLNMLHTDDRSLSFLLQYLSLTDRLVHLRLHLPAEQVTRWYGEMGSLREAQLPPLPRLCLLSLTLVDNKPIDARLPSLLQRLFPSLQVIVLTQYLIRSQPKKPAQFLERYLTLIKRHFSKTLLPGSSSLRLLEARIFLYQDEKCHHLLKTRERIWTAQKLGLR